MKSYVVNERECEAVGISHNTVRLIAKHLNAAARLASAHNVVIFGGAHSGSIRKHREHEDRAFILADIEGPFDGGDGGCYPDQDGYIRGE